ncbi:hypothetical protein DFH09DRAFT_1074880 [Mycena vulgaris]|nr:hypothetical protein DFH09DRAFT_1074880 [Mycena vulgaris]
MARGFKAPTRTLVVYRCAAQVTTSAAGVPRAIWVAGPMRAIMRLTVTSGHGVRRSCKLSSSLPPPRQEERYGANGRVVPTPEDESAGMLEWNFFVFEYGY